MAPESNHYNNSPNRSQRRHYLDVYPELVVFELPLFLVFIGILIASFGFLFTQFLYHFFHLLELSIPTLLQKASLFAKVTNWEEILFSTTIFTQLIDISIIITSVFILYYIGGRFIRLIQSRIDNFIFRVKSIPNRDLNRSRLQRMISHFIFDQLALFVWMGLIIIVWSVVFNLNSSDIEFTIISGVVLFGGITLYTVLMTYLQHRPSGQKYLDHYFEFVGGYTDGSVARRLHIPYKSIEELLEPKEINQLLSEQEQDVFRKQSLLRKIE